ncbi:MAG TPA: hypothetical protein VEW25_12810, partial [Allosphingosinicella sp.]|nr:hypothetical protein [Allosphingosinicella sp.]
DDGFGHAENFAPVRVVDDRSSRAKSRGASQEPLQRTSTSLGTNEVGKIRTVVITGVEAHTLIGVPG